MKIIQLVFAVVFLIFSTLPTFGQKLNESQVIGSHNSYKSAMPLPILEYLKKINPRTAESLEYEHLPLSEQLNLGLRNLELDVFHTGEVFFDIEGRDTEELMSSLLHQTNGFNQFLLVRSDGHTDSPTAARRLDNNWITDTFGYVVNATKVLFRFSG